MSDLVELFQKSVREFDSRVAAVNDEQWAAGTPCVEWDVRTLVNHIVNEDRWVTPLLDGKTIAEVGDALDGDLLGDDPKASWRAAADEATEAVGRPGVLERTVHVSFGDIPGREYISQVLCDHVLHSWDLAKGIGASTALDQDLVDFAYGYLEPVAEAWRAAGAFGPAVEVPEEADKQTRLLALTGRRP